MLNWIVWNETVFDIETLYSVTELFNIEQFWHLTVYKQNLYLHLPDLELTKLNSLK